jgi:L-lysine exporter family protein LysE/ArgO
MLEFFVQGFLLGLAYLAPIGMQNMYVINSAMRMGRLRAYQVALITCFFDISLALACFFGVGAVLELYPALRGLVLLIGILAATYIGIRLILSRPELKDIAMNEPMLRIAAMCFAVTWFNPNAIIDGTMLLGGIRASLPSEASGLFIAGVALASFFWFNGIVTLISVFKSRITSDLLRLINGVCGGIIVAYGLMLGYSFVELLGWKLF